MKMPRFLFPVLVALGICLVGCSKSDEDQAKSAEKESAATNMAARKLRPTGPVELKFKWTVGSRVVQHIELVQQSETFMAQMPKPVKNDVTMSQDYGLSVLKERSNGGREVELEFLSMQMVVSAADKVVMSFDTHGEAGEDEKNSMMAGFRTLVGQKVRFLLNASNRVEQVEGFQEFKSRFSTNVPPQARSMFEAMFSEDYLKQMVGDKQTLPSHPVKPGDTWSDQMEIAVGPMGTVVVDAKYTFKNWETKAKRNCAVLEFDGTLKTKQGQGGKFMGMNMMIEDGKMTGKSWFDPEAGMPVESAIKQDMKLLITMPPQPQRGARKTNVAPQPQMITNVMSQKVSVKIGPDELGGR